MLVTKKGNVFTPIYLSSASVLYQQFLLLSSPPSYPNNFNQMSSSMIPLPKDASYSKELLFQLETPVVLPVDQFDEVWPLVCNVYTFRNKNIQQNGAVQVEHGECRLKKSRRSSSSQPRVDDNPIKRRTSSIRDKDQCLVTVKLTRQLTGLRPIVTLERKTEHYHTHDFETSCMVKKSKFVQELIATEAEKNYSAAQIFSALRSAGSEEGSSRLEEAGGGFIKMYELINLFKYKITDILK